MAVNDIAKINPVSSMHNLDPSHQASPYTAYWWTNNYLSYVPGSAMPWLASQGWKVVETWQDTSTTPPTTYYGLAKQSMQNWIVLQNLINSFTSAYNEARWKNAKRYDDIVVIWNEMLQKSATHLDTMGDESNAHVTLYMSQLLCSHCRLKSA